MAQDDCLRQIYSALEEYANFTLSFFEEAESTLNYDVEARWNAGSAIRNGLERLLQRYNLIFPPINVNHPASKELLKELKTQHSILNDIIKNNTNGKRFQASKETLLELCFEAMNKITKLIAS